MGNYLADLERKYIALQKECEDLRKKVERLRDALDESFEAPPVLGLSPVHNRILTALVRRPSVSKEQMIYEAWPSKVGTDDEPNVKTLDVHLCKLRRALARHGVEVDTMHGQGWWIAPEHKEVLRRMHRESRLAPEKAWLGPSKRAIA